MNAVHTRMFPGLGAVLLFCSAAALAQSPEGRTYAPGTFERLEISGAANVRLTQGPQDQIFIAGGAEVQDSVRVSLDGERLEIHPNGSWKFWNSSRLQVEVQMKTLSQINISGASDLVAIGPVRVDRLSINISGAGSTRFDDLEAAQLRFSVQGAGDGQIKGKVGELTLSISGKGKLVADDLQARRASVSISGLGSAYVWATDTLRIHVGGIGSVEYWGSPRVEKHNGGVSSITARGAKPVAAAQGSASQ